MMHIIIVFVTFHIHDGLWHTKIPSPSYSITQSEPQSGKLVNHTSITCLVTSEVSSISLHAYID